MMSRFGCGSLLGGFHGKIRRPAFSDRSLWRFPLLVAQSMLGSVEP
jgi:hypothetical protein